jgi:hypothetical protein
MSQWARSAAKDSGAFELEGEPESAPRDATGAWLVRIDYSEPAFRLYNPHAPDVYSIVYRIDPAPSPDDAVRRAMQEWNHCQAHTRVGWNREIDRIEVRQAGLTSDGELPVARPTFNGPDRRRRSA